MYGCLLFLFLFLFYSNSNSNSNSLLIFSFLICLNSVQTFEKSTTENGITTLPPPTIVGGLWFWFELKLILCLFLFSFFVFKYFDSGFQYAVLWSYVRELRWFVSLFLRACGAIDAALSRLCWVGSFLCRFWNWGICVDWLHLFGKQQAAAQTTLSFLRLHARSYCPRNKRRSLGFS